MLKCTPVWRQNWSAINCGMLLDDDGYPVLDEQGDTMRAIRYIINEGSSRSSKTISLIDCADMYSRNNEDKRGTIWRDTKIDCKLTVLPDMELHLKKTDRYKVDQTFNITESKFKYETNCTIEFLGSDEINKVIGLGQDWAWFNEPYKFPKAVFDQIDQRTKDFIVIDWNPKEAHWIDDLKKDKRAIVIKSTFRDNAFCPPEQRNKILSYQPVSRSFVVESGIMSNEKAMVYDCFLNPFGIEPKPLRELSRCQDNEFKRSADDFNWSVYGMGEKAEKPHRILRMIEIPDEVFFNLRGVPEIYAVDWGKVDPFGVLHMKYYDGGLYFHQINYESEAIIKAKLSDTERKQMEAMEEGIVVKKFGEWKIDQNKPIICDDNRPGKILALRDVGYDYAVAADKGKGSIKDGLDILGGMPCYYTASSTDLKYEQENYSYQVDRFGNVLEDPVEDNNHLIDPARYGAKYWRSEGIIKNIV